MDGHDHVAAQVLAIFKKASDEQIFIIAAPHMPLSESDAVHDNYRQFGIVGGQLYYEQTSPPIVVPATQLITLFARTPFECAHIETPVIHVLPLYKVCTVCSGKPVLILISVFVGFPLACE